MMVTTENSMCSPIRKGGRFSGSIPSDPARARKEFSGKRGEITKLARKYGVSQPTMSEAISGKLWSHVP